MLCQAACSIKLLLCCWIKLLWWFCLCDSFSRLQESDLLIWEADSFSMKQTSWFGRQILAPGSRFQVLPPKNSGRVLMNSVRDLFSLAHLEKKVKYHRNCMVPDTIVPCLWYYKNLTNCHITIHHAVTTGGKAWAVYTWRQVQGRSLEGRGRKTQSMHCFKEECLFILYAEHNSKNRNGSFRDMTWRGLVGTSGLIRDWRYLLTSVSLEKLAWSQHST